MYMDFSPEKLDDTSREEDAPEVYEPQLRQIKQDIKFMLGINVDQIQHEEELHTPEIKAKIYAEVIRGLQDGNPFALEQFVLYKLISKEDIQATDMPEIKKYATKILGVLRSTSRLAVARELFIKMGILTEEEVKESR